MIRVEGGAGTHTLHEHGGAVIEVRRATRPAIAPGARVAPTGASGAGTSTLLRMIRGNCRTVTGQVVIAATDIVQAGPREIMAGRRATQRHVSQCPRMVPRVPAVGIVAGPCLTVDRDTARTRAETLPARLNFPPWPRGLSPTTFPRGQGQRVEIARGFAHPHPALPLDEPLAGLDTVNSDVVLDLIGAAKASGAAIIGIFHDAGARARVCDREIDMSASSPACAA